MVLEWWFIKKTDNVFSLFIALQYKKKKLFPFSFLLLLVVCVVVVVVCVVFVWCFVFISMALFMTANMYAIHDFSKGSEGKMSFSPPSYSCLLRSGNNGA